VCNYFLLPPRFRVSRGGNSWESILFFSNLSMRIVEVFRIIFWVERFRIFLEIYYLLFLSSIECNIEYSWRYIIVLQPKDIFLFIHSVVFLSSITFILRTSRSCDPSRGYGFVIIVFWCFSFACWNFNLSCLLEFSWAVS